LADRISTYLSPPLFPVRLADIPAHLQFHDAPEGPMTLGSLTVRSSLVTHQGPTVGYRIEEQGRSVVYLPDHEPGLGPGLSGRPVEWVSGYHLAHLADLLLHDAQYGDGEYPRHIGWGHSAIAHVVDFARIADVDRLLLFHHDPYHTDDDLELLVADAQRCWGAESERVQAACEGMTITLTADAVSIDPAGGAAHTNS
jgi:phosphoribosyl 1,2-cyclic phosphodiesterase